jgi:prepilin-type N-terminal cleavage/methylation domain-containing protein
MKQSFTLLELMIVLIIIGIMMSMGMVNHYKAVEMARIKQASAILRVIRDAQQNYRMRNGSAVTCATLASCRDLLGINAVMNLDEASWTLSCSSAAPAISVIRRTTGTYTGCEYSMYLNANDTMWKSAGTCP